MSVKQNLKEIASLVKNCSIKKISIKIFFELMEEQQSHYTDFTYAGNGAFAFVLRAKNNETGQIVALKVVECDNDDIGGMNSVMNEYEILNNLCSKYIVRVQNCFFLTLNDDLDEESKDVDKLQMSSSKIKNQKNEDKAFFVVEQEFCQSNFYSKSPFLNVVLSHQRRSKIQILKNIIYCFY